MADRAHRHGPQAGFTLIEMMVALGILVVGITTLLATLGDSMSLRAGADARLLAAAAVDDLVHRVASGGLARKKDADSDLELQLTVPAEVPVAGYSTMRLLPKIEDDKARFDVFLLRIRAVWMERGEEIEEEFLRVLPRQLSLGARVRRYRDEHSEKR